MNRAPLRMEPVTVTSASPLIIALADGSTHRAIGIQGQSYTPGSGVYVALRADGQMPFVFPVGTTGGTDNVIDGNA